MSLQKKLKINKKNHLKKSHSSVKNERQTSAQNPTKDIWILEYFKKASNETLTIKKEHKEQHLFGESRSKLTHLNDLLHSSAKKQMNYNKKDAIIKKINKTKEGLISKLMKIKSVELQKRTSNNGPFIENKNQKVYTKNIRNSNFRENRS